MSNKKLNYPPTMFPFMYPYPPPPYFNPPNQNNIKNGLPMNSGDSMPPPYFQYPPYGCPPYPMMFPPPPQPFYPPTEPIALRKDPEQQNRKKNKADFQTQKE